MLKEWGVKTVPKELVATPDLVEIQELMESRAKLDLQAKWVPEA